MKCRVGQIARSGSDFSSIILTGGVGWRERGGGVALTKAVWPAWLIVQICAQPSTADRAQAHMTWQGKGPTGYPCTGCGRNEGGRKKGVPRPAPAGRPKGPASQPASPARGVQEKQQGLWCTMLRRVCNSLVWCANCEKNHCCQIL